MVDALHVSTQKLKLPKSAMDVRAEAALLLCVGGVAGVLCGAVTLFYAPVELRWYNAGIAMAFVPILPAMLGWAILRVLRLKAAARTWAWLLHLSTAALGGAMLYNGYQDRGPETRQAVVPERVERFQGKVGVLYRAHVKPWAGGMGRTALVMPETLVTKAEAGEELVLRTRPGALGIAWIDGFVDERFEARQRAANVRSEH